MNQLKKYRSSLLPSAYFNYNGILYCFKLAGLNVY